MFHMLSARPSLPLFLFLLLPWNCSVSQETSQSAGQALRPGPHLGLLRWLALCLPFDVRPSPAVTSDVSGRLSSEGGPAGAFQWRPKGLEMKVLSQV